MERDEVRRGLDALRRAVLEVLLQPAVPAGGGLLLSQASPRPGGARTGPVGPGGRGHPGADDEQDPDDHDQAASSAEDEAEQQRLIAISDAYLAEVQAADVLVIGLPVYNFNLPAQLKNWLDQIARAGKSFRYTAEGPEGLLTGKRAIVAYSAAGTPIGSDFDHASGYVRFMLGFLGITDVDFVAADRLAMDRDAGLARAQEALEKLAA